MPTFEYLSCPWSSTPIWDSIILTQNAPDNENKNDEQVQNKIVNSNTELITIKKSTKDITLRMDMEIPIQFNYGTPLIIGNTQIVFHKNGSTVIYTITKPSYIKEGKLDNVANDDKIEVRRKQNNGQSNKCIYIDDSSIESPHCVLQFKDDKMIIIGCNSISGVYASVGSVDLLHGQITMKLDDKYLRLTKDSAPVSLKIGYIIESEKIQFISCKKIQPLQNEIKVYSRATMNIENKRAIVNIGSKHNNNEQPQNSIVQNDGQTTEITTRTAVDQNVIVTISKKEEDKKALSKKKIKISDSTENNKIINIVLKNCNPQLENIGISEEIIKRSIKTSMQYHQDNISRLTDITLKASQLFINEKNDQKDEKVLAGYINKLYDGTNREELQLASKDMFDIIYYTLKALDIQINEDTLREET